MDASDFTPVRNRTHVGEGLAELKRALAPFVQERMLTKYGKKWRSHAVKIFDRGPGEPVGEDFEHDEKNLLVLIRSDFRTFSPPLKSQDRTLIANLVAARNQCYHGEEIDLTSALHTHDCLCKLFVRLNHDAPEVEATRAALQAVFAEEVQSGSAPEAPNEEVQPAPVGRKLFPQKMVPIIGVGIVAALAIVGVLQFVDFQRDSNSTMPTNGEVPVLQPLESGPATPTSTLPDLVGGQQSAAAPGESRTPASVAAAARDESGSSSRRQPEESGVRASTSEDPDRPARQNTSSVEPPNGRAGSDLVRAPTPTEAQAAGAARPDTPTTLEAGLDSADFSQRTSSAAQQEQLERGREANLANSPTRDPTRVATPPAATSDQDVETPATLPPPNVVTSGDSRQPSDARLNPVTVQGFEFDVEQCAREGGRTGSVACTIWITNHRQDRNFFVGSGVGVVGFRCWDNLGNEYIGSQLRVGNRQMDPLGVTLISDLRTRAIFYIEGVEGTTLVRLRFNVGASDVGFFTVVLNDLPIESPA